MIVSPGNFPRPRSSVEVNRSGGGNIEAIGGTRMYRAFATTSILLLLASSPLPAAQSVQQVSFPASAGDQVIVENDFGRVRVTAWQRNEVEVTVRKLAAAADRLSSLDVLTQKAGPTIYLRAFFYDYRSESVQLDVKAPAGIALSVWGANPAVELEGLRGPVRVHTQTGRVTAVGLTGAASILTGSGDVELSLSSQPEADLRVEARRGAVQVRAHPELDGRFWMRAGGTLSWNREVELSGGQLERQQGIGGPLVFLASLEGDVRVDLQAAGGTSLPELPPDPPLPPQARDVPREEPVADRDAPSIPDPEPRDTGRYEPAPESGEVVEPSAQGPYTLKVDVNWTRLNASVRDPYTNRSVANLRKEDFLVYEDGRRQQVETFESTEAPFDLLLLLDVSGSTKSHNELIKRASVQFTREIKSNDRIAVAIFNSDTRLIQPFTNDRRQVARSIERIRSNGGTAFYDALDVSLHQYLAGREGRKAIVVFTDGVDNQLKGDPSDGSRITFRDLFRGIQETDTIIYTIFLDTEDRGGFGRRPPGRRGGGIGGILGDILSGRTGPMSDSEAYEEARRQLQAIADQTGGRMYSPRDIYDLDRVYSEIADDLRVQYTLVYASDRGVQDGAWREIRVEIRDRRELVVRTRRGYYADASRNP